MAEYTILAAASVVAVVLLELCILRTGVFRRLAYWLTMVIVLGFQVPVDGWLTKLDDPIVLYQEAMTTGIRFPWDIPIEDFGFGFSMITLTLMTWIRLGPRRRPQPPTTEQA